MILVGDLLVLPPPKKDKDGNPAPFDVRGRTNCETIKLNIFYIFTGNEFSELCMGVRCQSSQGVSGYVLAL